MGTSALELLLVPSLRSETRGYANNDLNLDVIKF
jgi:hypothetical protein